MPTSCWVPAVHSRLLILMNGMGLWEEFEAWKRKLVVTIARFCSEGECSIWDFACVSELLAIVERTD